MNGQQLAFHDEEQFVFGLVAMPDELAFELDQLEVRVVDLARDARMPIVLKEGWTGKSRLRHGYAKT